MDELIYTNIAKNLSGEATEADQQMLKDWLDADPQNRAVYEDIKSYWQDTDKVLEGPSFNTAAAWGRVADKIHSNSKGRIIPFKTLMRYSIAAAAVLVLGIFIVNNFAGQTIKLAANGKNMDVILSDGSHIILREGSVLRYPGKFTGKERNVSLEGEAFFEVARNEHMPFVINAQSATVKVLGTSFNVKCSENQASVVVRTGKVQMADRKHVASVILTPGEKGSLKNGALTEETVDINNFFYWRTGKISFNSQPLLKIADEISMLKDTAIFFDATVTEQQKQQLVTITFGDQPMDQMMTDLCLVAQCQWSKQNNAYLISSK